MSKMTDIIKDQLYTRQELQNLGLEPDMIGGIDLEVYKKDDKIYFFESVTDDIFRLFTILNNTSYFIK